jgi:hypothetical protein
VLVTDADEEGGQSAPEVIVTHFLSTVEDAVEHLRAADLLGSGVRLHSYLAATKDGSYSERWQLEVLAESPVQADDAEDDD